MVGGLLGTVFIFIFYMVVHGKMLAGQYEMYASLWRPQSEMESMMWFMILTEVMLAFTMAYFVNRLGRRGARGGARFGAMIGIFLAVLAVGNYAFMPLSFMLPLIWAAAIFVTSVGVGAIAGHFNK